MTPTQIRKQIALLKKDGINRTMYDVLSVYIGEVQGQNIPQDLPEIAKQIGDKLLELYKEQLPKKVVKSRQKDLQEEIDELLIESHLANKAAGL